MELADLEAGPASQPPTPDFCGEDTRNSVLAAFGLDALEDDPELARLARFAAQLCDAEVAMVTVVESERQRFLARTGIEERETPRSTSFCAHAMLEREPMVVHDARADDRFADNPLVTGAPHIRFYAGAPLVSLEGAPLGSLCVIDTAPRPGGLTELQFEGLEVLAAAAMRRLNHRRAELKERADLVRRAERLRKLGDWLPAIVWSADGTGKFDYFNARWKSITGREPPTDAEQWRPVVHPDDQERTFGKWYLSAEQGVAFEHEYRLLQADGSWRWTMSRAFPMTGADGAVTRWYGTLTDIDDAHRKLIDRELISDELSHRIKNIFAVVASLVSLRSRRHPESRALARELTEAITALGRAHDFIRPGHEDSGRTLRGLLEALVRPYVDEDVQRISVEGDDTPLGSRAATPLTLVFHELATNAAKYGALSVDEGRIAILLAECGDSICIRWREQCGPECKEPQHFGFGSRLLDTSITSQLGGTIERRWKREGLEVEFELPKAELARRH